MAGVLPPEIMDCTRKGLQAADWFEYLNAELPQMRAELEQLRGCPPVARYVNLDAIERCMHDWPSGGWTEPQVIRRWHLMLTRGIGVGMFIREAISGDLGVG
jgi:asparagine synthase (glutamine-hydrolysing)